MPNSKIHYRAACRDFPHKPALLPNRFRNRLSLEAHRSGRVACYMRLHRLEVLATRQREVVAAGESVKQDLRCTFAWNVPDTELLGVDKQERAVRVVSGCGRHNS